MGTFSAQSKPKKDSMNPKLGLFSKESAMPFHFLNTKTSATEISN